MNTFAAGVVATSNRAQRQWPWAGPRVVLCASTPTPTPTLTPTPTPGALPFAAYYPNAISYFYDYPGSPYVGGGRWARDHPGIDASPLAVPVAANAFIECAETLVELSMSDEDADAVNDSLSF